MSFTSRTSRSELLIAISSICCVFSGRFASAPPASRPKRSAQRRQRRAQLMRDGRDELVLHAVERAAFRRIGEGDDDAQRLQAVGIRRL